MAGNHITLTHINIRQSIAILLLKLITLDVLLAALVIGFYSALVQGDAFISGLSQNAPLFFTIFVASGLVKILVTSYVVLDWLFEYYEITPEYIAHKHGILFKKTEHYRIDAIRRIDVLDDLIGQFFNYGTIVVYDIRLNKYLDMFLIHNPGRYAKVLRELRPTIEVKEDSTWFPFVKVREVIPSED